MQAHDRQPSRVVHCPNCGAPNPDQSPYCSSCGVRLPEQADEEEVLIDVSRGEPEILDSDQPAGGYSQRTFGGFTTVTFDRGRVIVSRGGGRGCLLAAIVAGLLLCCLCYFLWTIPAQLF